MAYNYKLTMLAKEDIKRISSFSYSSDFIERLSTRIDLISIFPTMYPIYAKLNNSKIVLRKGIINKNYVFYYIFVNKEIIIIRIFNQLENHEVKIQAYKI